MRRGKARTPQAKPIEKSDGRQRRLLRACCDRPRGRPAQKGYELAPLHVGYGPTEDVTTNKGQTFCNSLPQHGLQVLGVVLNSEARLGLGPPVMGVLMPSSGHLHHSS